MKPIQLILGLLKIPVDFLMGTVAFLVAYHLRTITDLIPGVQLPLDLDVFPAIEDYMSFGVTAILVLITLMALSRTYSLKFTPRLSRELGGTVILSSAWFMLIIAYFFIIHEFPFSRLVLAYSWILATIFICVGRSFIRFIEYGFLRANIGKTRLLFIGNNEITEILTRQMSKDPRYDIVGLIDDGLFHHKSSITHLGHVDKLSEIVEKKEVEEIIQTKHDLSDAQASDIREFCREHHIAYSFVPDLLSVQQTNVEVETLSGIPIIKLKPTPLDGWGRVIKRLFDLTGAGAGLIILSPFLLISALCIKLDSRGTIIFKYLDDGSRVKRVGQQGKLFNFYKFRTMYPKTHNLRYTELAEKNTREGSPLVKIKDDPRVTRVGRFLRKTSIDELPQLLNVLKGEMSLVGPRPHLPEEVANYKKHHKFVLTIKPGITGMAQISGRSDLDFEEEVRLDTYYIEHWSLWLDIKIIFKTFGALLKGYKE
ncbi:MAG TPA: sugar transferase [Candidatus Gracilibacteria bacterium]|nr:sugar transferase [Candidatus Gracilibacteria bacterium]